MTEVRNKVLSIRLNTKEYNDLQVAAKDIGLLPSTFLRFLLLQYTNKNKEEVQEYGKKG